MRIFITSSFGDSKESIENLCEIIRSAGVEDFSFIRDIEHFERVFNDPKELMQQSREEIVRSDALLIDMTEKPTGRAIEAGIAYALNKPVIVILRKGTEIKETTKGIASLLVEYDNLSDIREPLKNFLSTKK